VLDLDPDPALDFEVVRLAAAVVRDRLSDIGLKSLPLVTGGKGIHVVAPLRRTADWEAVKTFARSFAESLASRHPDVFVATMSKQRRRGKIFLDWLRNDRGSTAIAPYSSRARQGAPVAAPLSWQQLAKVEAADAFHLDDMVRRAGQADPWADYGKITQSITRKMQERVSRTPA
jgi:bifunctional non-homologous end joining protein LigD